MFDPLKAKAQVQVYKEIYNIKDDNKVSDAELRILKNASKEDLKDIDAFFKKAQGEGKSK